MRGDNYQWALIILACVVTLMVGVFIYRELFPEYKIYQNAYVQMEEFRAEHTGESPASFYKEVKQILLPVANNGPDKLDRCITCHVALKLEHFSPTKIAYDINGKVMVDSEGIPLKVPNDEYVWKLLDDKIAELTDPQVLAQLEKEGRSGEVKDRRNQAEHLASLKSYELHERKVDMARVLAMHPLIGQELTPFQFHPMEKFGCTVCHSGNGRSIVSDRAHGPVFDGEYEIEEHYGVPQFLESDEDNDPRFSKVFNHKPGHRLLFHTKPLMTGKLIEAQCAQCHQTAEEQISSAVAKVDVMQRQKETRLTTLKQSIEHDQEALSAFLESKSDIRAIGIDKAIDKYKGRLGDYTLREDALDSLGSRVRYLMALKEKASLQPIAESKDLDKIVLDAIDDDIFKIIGSRELLSSLENAYSAAPEQEKPSAIKKFLLDHKNDNNASGDLFAKLVNQQKFESAIAKLEFAKEPLADIGHDSQTVQLLASESDKMSDGYKRGQSLFITQACNACHRVNGLSRGGIGPELTTIGFSYPWYVKEAIVWPDSNVEGSQMPNFRLDHEDIEDLMTYLMAQKGEKKSVSDFDQTVTMKAWESGEKLPWEKALVPSEVRNLRSSMVIFATQGCASCHKLRGFDGNAGFAIEKGKPSFDDLYKEREWFQKIFPEDAAGSQLAAAIDRHSEEIDKRLDRQVRQNGLLEEIERISPNTIESFYANFKFARRAKDKNYQEKISKASSEEEKNVARQGLQKWHDRIDTVLMVYIQQYGLGRDIGPHLHWSGVYRSEEWLIEHFRNPSAHTAKSIMPVMPFDDTKFYALTYMLQELGKKNRDEQHEIWSQRGFDPQQAFHTHCASCHGQTMYGNGPVAEKLYPIPKNLRNATFLRNLTKAEVKHSITHGVKGGPMAPWGEAPISNAYTDGKPVFNEHEIDQLADWLFSSLPGGEVIKKDTDVEKWQYTPDQFIKELKEEGQKIPRPKQPEIHSALDLLPKGEGLYASLKPQIYLASDEITVGELFDELPGTPDTDGKPRYYIKKDLYTQENIQAGQSFFIVNCAHCHGKEGGGNGARASLMREAKPRMLTNLPWLRTRDDIWLLRSIKFGVAGTSMTPWGDQTTALQRLQLVIFIRSLTEEKKDREDLQTHIYHAFEVGMQAIQEAREQSYSSIENLNRLLKQTRAKKEEAFLSVEEGKGNPEEASKLYAEELLVIQQINKAKAHDDFYQKLAENVEEETTLYNNLGVVLIRRNMGSAILQKYFDIIDLNKGRYKTTDGNLTQALDPKNEEAIESANADILQTIEQRLKSIEQQKKTFEGHLPSAARTEKLRELDVEKTDVEKLLHRLIGDFAQARRLRQEQQKIFAAFSQAATAKGK